MVELLQPERIGVHLSEELQLHPVFPDTGGRPMNPKDDAEAWRSICQLSGVRVLTLHSARHTMVSILLEHGVPADVIRQIAGHSSVLSTRNYMHVGQDQARRALETWSP